MSRFIEIPDDGIIRIPIIEDDVKIGERCIDLSDVPAIEAKPVVRGEWDMTNADDDFVSGIGCSVCGHMIISLGKYNWRKVAKDWNFCPNCGADMRGETE